MGALENFVLSGFAILAFAIMAAQMTGVAVQEGGHPDIAYPGSNLTDNYMAQSKNFSDDFMASVQEVQNAPPEATLASQGLFSASATVKAITFTSTSLGMVIGIITSNIAYVVGVLGIDGWVLALGISAIVVIFAFAILSVLSRYPA